MPADPANPGPRPAPTPEVRLPGHDGEVRSPDDHRTPPLRTVVDVLSARSLFWHNVVREVLTSLSVETMNHHAQPAGPPQAPGGAPPDPSPGDGLFDGRLAILTHAGERIPIAAVYPLLACGIPTSAASRALSIAVECSVFQVRTPAGEVFTLPLHEVRGLHALTPELVEQLEAAARRQAAGEPGADQPGVEPFGFAAFTSLQRSRDEPPEPPPA